jgi:hypothetical protein
MPRQGTDKRRALRDPAEEVERSRPTIAKVSNTRGCVRDLSQVDCLWHS